MARARQARPQVSALARAILGVAREIDAGGAIAGNVALRIVLEVCEALPAAARADPAAIARELLAGEEPPRDFLELAAALLRRVESRLDERQRLRSRQRERLFSRDFDEPVLQGFAQALAALVWPERDGRDFDGPSLSVCRRRLAGLTPAALWQAVLQHYLANVLQYYFSAAQVRREVRGLDPEIESDLRELDARRIAEYTLELAAASPTGPPTPERIAAALERALAAVLENA